MSRFFFCWRACSTLRVRYETMTVSSGPSSLIQTGRISWPRVGSSMADWPPIW